MTPLQKLIKQFEELKDSNLESSIDVDFAISLTKSLLEKEKEFVKGVWLDGKNSRINGQDPMEQIKNL